VLKGFRAISPSNPKEKLLLLNYPLLPSQQRQLLLYNFGKWLPYCL